MRAAAWVLVVAIVVALAGIAGAQPTPPPGPPGAGSGSAVKPQPTRIDLQPGRPVLQPVRPGQPPLVRPAPGAGSAAAPAAWVAPTHNDIKVGTGADNKLFALLFWAFALLTVGGAAFVITRRNLIAAVMGMVGTFFGIAAVYMMLYASFLAVVQMLVYAGAIMVLFVFVIMILNKPEAEPYAGVSKVGKGIAGLGLAYLAFRLVALLWSVIPLKTSGAAPAPLEVAIGKDPEKVKYAWGGIKSVGTTLFNSYLFPFEAVSILLLVAVVGAIAIARPLKDDDGVPPPEGQP